jgi:hypothetical protein
MKIAQQHSASQSFALARRNDVEKEASQVARSHTFKNTLKFYFAVAQKASERAREKDFKSQIYFQSPAIIREVSGVL